MSHHDEAFGASRTPGCRHSLRTALRLFIPSLLGIVIFFVPVTLAGRTTILLDHMVSGARALLGAADGWYALALIVAGAAYPLVTGRWKRSVTEKVFTVLKLLGVIAAVMALSGWGPAVLHTPDMLPFLFEKLVIPVGLIVPIGAVFLALLIGYGLLELIGILLQPVMRPIWRTPGKSAIDAVASFTIPLSVGRIVMVWFLRTALSLLLAVPAGYLVRAMIGG